MMSMPNEWVHFDNTSHIIYALNKKPITDQIYENLTRWTTDWCARIPTEDQYK